MNDDLFTVPAHRRDAGSLADQLANAIDDRIQALGLAKGTPLGTLEDIRLGSGLSKPTVSEAVRILRDRGTLRIKPGRGGGLFVADPSPVVRLRQTLLRVDENPTAVADAIELRSHLELLIALGAARCRSSQDVRDLRRLVDDMAAAPDWPTFMRANWALHERMAQISPNAIARAVYVSTLGQIDVSTARNADADPGSYQATRLEVHRSLVEAIASGDAAAVRAAVARHHGESSASPSVANDES